MRHGNFSRAAHALFLTQPTVSANIDALEGALGAPLFERRQRKAQLTTAGKIFYPYAVQLLHTAEAGALALKNWQEQITGEVRVAASSTPGLYLLPCILTAFHQRYNAVSFSISLSDSSRVIERLLNYEVDLGLLGTAPNHPLLESTPILEDELVVVGSTKRRFLPADRTEVCLTELADLPLVMRGSGSATREVLYGLLEAHDIPAHSLRIVAEVDSLEGVKECVRSGLGLGVLSKLCLIRNPDLIAYSFADAIPKRHFHVVSHRKSALTPAGTLLYRYLSREEGLKQRCSE